MEAVQGAQTFPWLEVALSFHLVMLASRGLGGRSSGNLYSSVHVGAVGRTWPLRSNAERALPSTCCLPTLVGPRPASPMMISTPVGCMQPC